MKILVTGGAGFIGSNFIYYIRQQEPDTHIICLDKLTYAGHLGTLKPLLNTSGFDFIQGDIADCVLIDKIFAEFQPDYVLNFAAESHVDRSIEEPSIFLKTNVIGTQTLLDACRRFPVKRFHQVSTDEVYGDLPLERPDLFFTEQTPLHTSSPYSASKAGADLLCLAYYRTYQLPITISRCSNNYGPYQFPEKLIPLMIMNAIKNKPLPVYGNGQNVRDWLYVEDHCRAVDLIRKYGTPGTIYNVGGHNEKRNIDIVTTILDILGKPYSLIHYVEDRKGHDLRYAIDPSFIQQELSWKPQISFDIGIVKTVEWYLANTEWVDDVSIRKE